MDERVYYINLYDYYGSLLTEKQQAYFEDYYFNNLSFQEISELYGISRNAIFKMVKEVNNKLELFESKLSLLSKGILIKELIKDLDIKDKINDLI